MQEIIALSAQLSLQVRELIEKRGYSAQEVVADMAARLDQIPPELCPPNERSVVLRPLPSGKLAVIDITIGPAQAMIGPVPLHKAAAAVPPAPLEDKCSGPHASCPACQKATVCFNGVGREKALQRAEHGVCPGCASFLRLLWPEGVEAPTFRMMTVEELAELSDDDRIQLMRIRSRIESNQPRSGA